MLRRRRIYAEEAEDVAAQARLVQMRGQRLRKNVQIHIDLSPSLGQPQTVFHEHCQGPEAQAAEGFDYQFFLVIHAFLRWIVTLGKFFHVERFQWGFETEPV